MDPVGPDLPEGQQFHLALKAERQKALRAYFAEHLHEPAAVHLEIGCGHGHYLTAFAEAHPMDTCVGIDLVTKRIEKARQKQEKRQLSRLHFLKAEVKECLEVWPAHLTVERIFILFPDPWPKKRHTKNRIVQVTLLETLARIARPGAELCFRTDHEGQFAWGMECLRASPFWQIHTDREWPFEGDSYFQEITGQQYCSSMALRI
jgi:tRNA (guanine-N7-)-methyltransferase